MQSKKIVTLLVFLIFLLFIFTAGCIWSDLIICKSIDIKNDFDFHYLSYAKMITDGNESINKIVIDTSVYGKNPQRLVEIADLITQNFTDPFWSYQKEDFCTFFRQDGSTWSDWCMYYGNTSFSDIIYRHDKNGRVRVQITNDLSNDAKWIAYQKTGGCQDISLLFNETANRSGFITQVVRADGVHHFWVEVNINDQWKTFDVQKYGKKTFDSSNWTGKRADYVNNSDFPNRCELVKCGVYVFDQKNDGYGENITQFYDPDFECMHGRYDYPECKKTS